MVAGAEVGGGGKRSFLFGGSLNPVLGIPRGER